MTATQWYDILSRAEDVRSSAFRRASAAAPSAKSPSRPDPRPGRRRARLPGLLPALALLLGALSLFKSTPAKAQTTIWSATLSVQQTSISGNPVGCQFSSEGTDIIRAVMHAKGVAS